MSTPFAHGRRMSTVAVGGAAGDGIREAGTHAAELARRIGCHAFLAFYYPSLIRGGHNFARISFSREPIYADHTYLDAYISVNADSVKARAAELAPDALVIVEESYIAEARAAVPGALALPMNAFVKEANAPHAAAPSVGIGALAYALGLSRERFATLCADIFSDLVGGKEVNTGLALRGYDHASANGFPRTEGFADESAALCPGELIEGNRAVGRGLLTGGVQFYVAYPMTPSTSILHFLAKEAATTGRLKVIHPEDEISVINMALGIAYTGTRVAIGTANGGFALMQEAFSFAGVSELPLVVVVSQRQGPATGVATHTGQSDLRFILHAGHGEFPRLVVAPGDVDECHDVAAMALGLAWRYQIPALIILDKHISESHGVATTDMNTPRIGEVVRWDPAAHPEYNRYRITESGVSPFASPGTPGAHVKATSYEHDEFGVAEDESPKVLAMQDKRWRKLEGLKSEFVHFPTVKVLGDPSAETAVVFWGSTKGAVREAVRLLGKPLRLVQILWMEPFDEAAVVAALQGATKIIAVEGSHGVQIAGLIREKTGIVATDTIARYDAAPFAPHELAEELARRIA